MPRIYVLDTNVLLHNPKSLFVFEEHEVVIPNWVLEEVDKFKSDQTVLGFNARTTGRYLDKMRERGSLKAGVPLNGGGTLRVDWDGDLNTEPPSSMDNAILKTAQRLRVTNPGHHVVLVSRDINMRVKADALGILAENYRHDQAAEPDKQYTGYQEVDCLDQDVENFYAGTQPEAGLLPEGLNVHEFVHLKGTSKSSALARWDGTKLVKVPKFNVWKIQPRNREQSFALDLLMNPEIKLVTLSGIAGCGKSLLALCAGLQQVCDQQTYTKLLVSRPVIPMGKDIGYLPGSIQEKLAPWMQPIFDNLEVILPGKPGSDRGATDASYQHLIDRGMVQVEALTYIRGRSIPNQFMLVDEAQNLNPHELKTILTRAGEGTKIVLTGDPAQIDNPYVDARSNGLSYTIERFKDSKIAGHVTLSKGERSQLSEEATQRL